MATYTQECYESQMEVFRAESAKFRKAQQDYRARLIDDAQFLQARAHFDAADQMADWALKQYLKDNPL